MAIRISRNEQGNCINFIGSTMPAYWNACLSARLNPDNSALVDIINDIRSENESELKFEFYAADFNQFSDKDNNPFVSAQEMVDYVNANANVTGVSEVGSSLEGKTVDFRLDDTSTSIILDNGSSFGVNTIKAVADTDGTIHIHAIGAGIPSGSDEPLDHRHFEKLDHGSVSINESPVSGGLQDVVNALNELFTVGAFQSVVITDPEATVIADVDGVTANGAAVGSNSIDPLGDDVLGTTATHNNAAGWLSSDTIDQTGEYFTFDIAGKGTYGFGLVHTDAGYAAGDYSGSATYADPSGFCVGPNSSHYGYQFSHFFHIGNAHASWTNYGANTGYVMGPAWHSHNTEFDLKDEWNAGDPVKVKVGLSEGGFIEIATLADDGVSWKLHARSSYPVPEGTEYRLGVKLSTTPSRLRTLPNVHLREPAAPVLNFRYIESPDGTYQWPLFATEEEANYYDANHTIGSPGSGTSHTHVFEDDPTATTWHMPDTGSTMTDNSDPIGVTFASQSVAWTEITSLTNSDLVPPAFADTTITVDELSMVNYQLSPVDVGYVTTIGGTPNWSLAGGTTLLGLAPEVTGDNVTNPSDTTTVTVYRTNSYGTSSGTLTINITNLTAPPVTPIAGVTLEGGTALVDSDTMGDGSVISIDDVVEAGNRVIVNKEWLDNVVLPAITSGSGSKSVWLGFVAQGVTPDYSSISNADFRIAYEFNCDDASRAANNWRLKTHIQGTSLANVGVGGTTSGLYDYVFLNEGTHVRAGGLVASQGHNASTKVFDPNDGDWNWTLFNTSDGASQDLIIATVNTTLDIDLSEFSEVAEPAPPVSNLTSWNKALDFSGSSERAQQVSTSSSWNALRMRGFANTVNPHSSLGTWSAPHTLTSDQNSACPWATAIVFRSDRHNSNQHIWNLGEGAGGNDDNIYLRQSASGSLHFGWGRDGALNECAIGNVSSTTGWHGIYIAHKGARFSGASATAGNLAEAFSIRRMGSEWAQPFGSLGSELSTSGNWVTTGGRMDRSVTGDFTIGGRGSNRSFHGKVAAMTLTTLERDAEMPDDTEIEMLITDPVRWIQDYREGNNFRMAGSSTSGAWDGQSSFYHATGVQMWLMGNTSTDSYSNMIRNYVNPTDQNYTKLNMISMVSNDIQTVNINGLTS